MAGKKIVLLAGEGVSSHVVYHAVHAALGIHAVILEAPVDKKTFLKRRIKKLGLPKVIAQVLFQSLIVPLLHAGSKKRIAAIKQQYQLDDSPIPENIIERVPSVNSDATIALLQQLQPDLVIVNGTRIIAEKVLRSVNCRFINTHAGITPAYRGVHGAYWALASNDAGNAGVTVHLVDKGIDTGSVLYQALILIDKTDNFTTYPLLQLAAGIPLLIKASEDVLNGSLQTVKGTTQSGLWSHPGIFEYVYRRLIKKVK